MIDETITWDKEFYRGMKSQPWKYCLFETAPQERKRGGKKEGSKNITSFPGEMQQAVGGKQQRPRRETEKEKECSFLSIHPDFKAEAW